MYFTIIDESEQLDPIKTYYEKDEKYDVIHWQSYEYDGNGNRVERKHFDKNGNITLWEKHFFDDNGNRIKTEGSERYLNFTKHIEYKFDENGNEIGVKLFHNGELTGQEINQYDSNNQEIKHERLDKNGNMFFSKEFIYDKNGNMIETKGYEGENMILWEKYEYDTDGNKIKKLTLEPDGNIMYLIIYEFDTNRMTSEKIFLYEDHLKDHIIIDYNEKGELIVKKEFRDGELTLKIYYNDENGNYVEVRTFDSMGNNKAWLKVKNDENGNRVERKTFDTKENLLTWKKFKYENDNLVEMKEFDVPSPHIQKEVNLQTDN